MRDNQTNPATYKRAYLGLGSNLNQPRQQIDRAIAAIAQFPDTQWIRTASYYRTSPVGPVEQDDFVNTVVAIDTRLPPHMLMDHCLALENAQQRRRDLHWGPRVIDCDVLWLQDCELTDPHITLPHPRMSQRLFVLVPLAELAPEFTFANGQNITKTIDELHAQLIKSNQLQSITVIDD